MSMPATTHKPGGRLAELSPFELEPQPGREPGKGPAPHPAMPFTRSAYGCVEWFQYLDRAETRPPVPTPGGGARRP